MYYVVRTPYSGLWPHQRICKRASYLCVCSGVRTTSTTSNKKNSWWRLNGSYYYHTADSVTEGQQLRSLFKSSDERNRVALVVPPVLMLCCCSRSISLLVHLAMLVPWLSTFGGCSQHQWELTWFPPHAAHGQEVCGTRRCQWAKALVGARRGGVVVSFCNQVGWWVHILSCPCLVLLSNFSVCALSGWLSVECRCLSKWCIYWHC